MSSRDDRYRLSRSGPVQLAYDMARDDPSFLQSVPRSGLSTNKYPYSLSCGIYNYVFWRAPACERPCTCGSGGEWLLSDRDVAHLLPSNLEVICYVNPPSRRSVPQIPHLNVFVRENVMTRNKMLVHTFASTSDYVQMYIPEDLEVVRVRWDDDMVRALWASSVLSRWKGYSVIHSRSITLLAILLVFGGAVVNGTPLPCVLKKECLLAYHTVCYESIADRVIGDDSILVTSPFNPQVYEYMDYLCGIGRFEKLRSVSSAKSFSSFFSSLEQWEQDNIYICNCLFTSSSPS